MTKYQSKINVILLHLLYQNHRYLESTKDILSLFLSAVFSSPLSLTCIVDGVPHLVTVDATRLVGVVVLKDSLKDSRSEFEETRLIPQRVKWGRL